MNNTPVNELDVEQVQEMIAKGEKINIIDVREDDEWESGHITEAKHIPLGTLTERHQELDPDQVTIMVCRSGGRSARACEYLTQQGYQVINMSGGMLAWDGPVAYGK
ncbi:rhodanese-like domain-containing protein [Paenibacillus glacialis]|uniref:Sulfurtransferase n=1 Tax=Paenibacillus glacialis TaxID=494026 RepID=A0A168NTN1_9BACL|nr:rhodanese-like domain-containing protein [Paenibacillus glacialis]OAB46101.1 sulfurtransferase [Paenibacillus glacialis]